MSAYTRAAATALRMLTKFGRDVTLRSTTPGTYDPATGTTTPTSSDTTRKGALFDFGSGQTLERGTLILANDKRLLMDATGPVDAHDRIVIGALEYAIVSVGEINPAGVSVLFDMHLRA